MARGSTAANTAASSAQGLSNTLQGNAASTFGSLMPELQSEVANPSGFNPVDKARMTTEAQQGAGGSQAGAVGQGALLASRTKNPGAASSAIAQSSRNSGQQLSKDTLATNLADQSLKEKQRSQGISGLEGLNSTELGGGINALGEVAPAVNANTNAFNSSYDWTKDILDPLVSAAGGAAPSIQKAFG